MPQILATPSGKHTWGLTGPAVRLGFSRIKGLRQTDVTKIVEAQKHGTFASIEEFHHRTHLSVDAVERLANADYDRYRAAARHAGLLQADGYVERQGQVVHVLALRLHDLTPPLEGHRFRSRDFH